MKKNSSTCKLNFSCIIGSEGGSLKIINGFDWKVENELKFNIGPINAIKKHNDQFFLSTINKLYNVDLSEESNSIYYSRKGNSENIVGFDFFDDKVIIAYNDVVHVVKENELISNFGNGKLSCFKLLRNGDVAVGGINTEMSIYNILSNETPIFTSKGEPNKGLSLPAKVNMTSIEQDVESDNIIYCGTKFNTVQLYDIRSNQRKAQLTANFEPNRSVVTLSALAANKVVAGSNGGCLGIIDFKFIHKTKPKSSEFISNYAKFKGFLAGSVSDAEIVKSVLCESANRSTKDILLATSFDGHLAVFDIASREMMNKLYLDKKPLSIFVEGVNQNETDDLWEDLESIEQTMHRKRTKSNDEIISSNKKSKNK